MSSTGKQPRRRLGDLLVEAGLITRDQLSDALEYQRLWGHRLGTALVAKQYISEFELIDVLGRELKLQTADPLDIDIPQDVLDLVPKALAAQHDLIPVGLEQVGPIRKLVIAMSDPMNIDAISQVRAVTRMDVQPVISTMQSVARAIHKNYGVMSAASKLPAFADSEMVIVHKGGGEVKVGTSGFEEAITDTRKPVRDPFGPPSAPAPRANDDTTQVPARLQYPPAAPPAWPPQQNFAPPPQQNFAPSPYPSLPPTFTPNLAYPLAGGLYPALPPQVGQPLSATYPMMQGYPGQTPLPMPSPYGQPPYAPMTPLPQAGPTIGFGQQTLSSSNGQSTLPSAAPNPTPAPKPPSPGVSLAVMEEVSKHAPKELMLTIVKLLLRRGLLNGDELLAELRKRR